MDFFQSHKLFDQVTVAKHQDLVLADQLRTRWASDVPRNLVVYFDFEVLLHARNAKMMLTVVEHVDVALLKVFHADAAIEHHWLLLNYLLLYFFVIKLLAEL